jgi:thiamine pyrophosphokinase
LDALPSDALVIAADSGLEHARALGLRVDLVVGDMDSVSAAALDAAAAEGVLIERHPEAKDATDLELALDVAVDRGARRIVVLGPDVGRLDHLLAAIALLTSPRYAAAEVEGWLGPAWLTVVRSSSRSRAARSGATLVGWPGALVTLLPVHGPAKGVTTDGLLYPLRDEDLEPGSTRGVSNEMMGERAEVTLRSGVLIAILPGETGTHWLRAERRGAR